MAARSTAVKEMKRSNCTQIYYYLNFILFYLKEKVRGRGFGHKVGEVSQGSTMQGLGSHGEEFDLGQKQ